MTEGDRSSWNGLCFVRVWRPGSRPSQAHAFKVSQYFPGRHGTSPFPFPLFELLRCSSWHLLFLSLLVGGGFSGCSVWSSRVQGVFQISCFFWPHRNAWPGRALRNGRIGLEWRYMSLGRGKAGTKREAASRGGLQRRSKRSPVVVWPKAEKSLSSGKGSLVITETAYCSCWWWWSWRCWYRCCWLRGDCCCHRDLSETSHMRKFQAAATLKMFHVPSSCPLVVRNTCGHKYSALKQTNGAIIGRAEGLRSIQMGEISPVAQGKQTLQPTKTPSSKAMHRGHITQHGDRNHLCSKLSPFCKGRTRSLRALDPCGPPRWTWQSAPQGFMRSRGEPWTGPAKKCWRPTMQKEIKGRDFGPKIKGFRPEN